MDCKWRAERRDVILIMDIRENSAVMKGILAIVVERTKWHRVRGSATMTVFEVSFGLLVGNRRAVIVMMAAEDCDQKG